MVNTKNNIVLCPIGKVEERVLDSLGKELEKKFNCRVERQTPIEVPQEAYNPRRRQYDSSFILDKLSALLKLGKQNKALGIADVDLYAEGLNFVFGEAESGGQFAVISLARLRQDFYALPEDEAVFLERAKKEAVHELGHVFGLPHCPDPECVMHFSNSLMDTDRKSASFCPNCQARLEKLINR